ncbi:MAG: hypothetical protein ACKOC8_05800 [Pirellulales bacterium]
MRRPLRHMTTVALLATFALGAAAMSRALAGCTGCTGGCQECVPACSGTWDEKKSTKPAYSMKCDYACARGRDSWHAPAPECRCSPPCGRVYVKKRFYKADGEEKVERVPKYEVRMVAEEPCGCPSCADGGLCWWNPLALIRHCFAGR